MSQRRVRSSNSAVPVLFTATDFRWNSSNTVNYVNGNVDGQTRNMTDIVSSNYRKRIEHGEVIFNPMSSVKTSYSVSRGTRVVTYTAAPPPYATGTLWKTTRDGNNGLGYPDYVLPDASGLLLSACTSALANIERPEVSGGIILGEMLTTLKMIRHPLDSLNTLSKKVLKRRKLLLLKQAAIEKKLLRMRRTKRVGASGNVDKILEERLARTEIELKDVLKAIAGTHLEIQFGVMPLINDLRTIVKQLGNWKPPRLTARGKDSTMVETTGTRNYNDGQVRGIITDFTRVTTTVRASCFYETRAENTTQWGVALSQLPLTVWQLLPLSFVVDWGLNVGRLIAAWTPNFQIRRLAEGVVRITLIEQTSTLGPITAVSAGWTATGGGDVVTRTIEIRERMPMNLGTQTGLFWHARMNTGKWFSSLSLILQRLL